jgi:enoyl-[acyl-carrier-protein] reductase (NADH)
MMIDFHTRETPMAAIFGEGVRVQYDDQDEQKIDVLAAQLTDIAVGMLTTLGEYKAELSAPIDEDSQDRMKAARWELVERWGHLQFLTSKIAYVTRIDGQEAYKRYVEFMADVNETPGLDVSGL